MFQRQAYIFETAEFLGGTTISKENLINEEIREKEVRVIDTDGTMLGVMPTQQAMDLANEKKLDLVNISPNAKPPVCKILDYGKYRYELQKKEKEARKKQKTMEIKGSFVSSITTFRIRIMNQQSDLYIQDSQRIQRLIENFV